MRRRILSMAGVMGLALLVMAGSVSPAGAAAIVLSGSPSGFESGDGNLALDSTTAGANTDWNCFLGQTGFQAGTPSANCKVKTAAVATQADQGGETTWKAGQKFDTMCPVLITGSVPNKDDFTYVASFSDVDSSLNTYFYGATIRATANGNASGDVEFNQLTNGAGCRSANDRLLAYDYLNGGTNLDFHVLTWIDSGNSTAGGNSGTCFVKTDTMPCWGANVLTPDPSLFNGQANQSAISHTDNGISGTDLVQEQFAEFGINLTQALGLTGCFSYPQQVWESRSSGSSFTSNPEDIEIQSNTIANCGQIIIRKVTSPSPDPLSTNFTFNDTGGLTPTSFQLANGGKKDFGTSVLQGSYGVSETTNSSYTLSNIDCSASTLTGGSSVSYGTSDTSFKAGDTSISITLKPKDKIDCTFTNTLKIGSLVILKESTKSTNPLVTVAGAKFCYSSSTGCTSTTGSQVTDTTDSTGGDSDTGTGKICVAGVVIGTYYVNEVSAPTGYGLPAGNKTANKSVTVVSGTNCTTNEPSTSSNSTSVVQFTDPPLTDLTVTVASEVTGGTASNITCTDASSNDIANSPQPPDVNGSTQYAASATVTANAAGKNALVPGTYTCVITVDP